jgi:hypothetical protein
MKINEVLDASDAEAGKTWYLKNTLKSHDGLYYIDDDGKLCIKERTYGDIIYKHSVTEVPYALNANGHAVSFLDLNMTNLEKVVMPNNVKKVNIENCKFDDLKGLENAVNQKYIINVYLEDISITSGVGLPATLGNLIIKDCGLLESLDGSKLRTAVGEVAISDCGRFTSLAGLPGDVDVLLLANLPSLTSLEGIAKTVKKCRVIEFHDNIPVKSSILGLMKMGLKEIHYTRLRGIETQDFKKALDIVVKHLASGDVAECIDELMDAGLKDFAKM